MVVDDVEDAEIVREGPFFGLRHVHEGRDDPDVAVEGEANRLLLRLDEGFAAIGVAREVRLGHAGVDEPCAELLGPDGRRQQEEGVAALDDGRGTLRAGLAFDLRILRHKGVAGEVTVEVEAHDLVGGDLEAAGEGAGELRLERVALSILEGNGGYLAGAISAHGQGEGDRAVLSAG